MAYKVRVLAGVRVFNLGIIKLRFDCNKLDSINANNYFINVLKNKKKK